MNFRQRLVKFGCVGLVMVMFGSTVSAQVLPRNKRAAANRASNTAQAVEQDANAAAQSTERSTTARTQVEGGAEDRTTVDAQRTRVRTGADANVRQSTRTTVTRPGTNVLRSTQLIGTVVSVQDHRMGEITEIVFNENGCIWYVVVDMDGRMAPIPWRVGNYNYQNRTFIIDNFEQARIERIPTFTTFEQFTDQAFVGEVDEFFGVQADERTEVDTRVDTNVRTNDAGQATSRTQQLNQKDSTTKRARTTAQDQEKASQPEGREGAAADIQNKSKTKLDSGSQPASSSKSRAKSDNPDAAAEPVTDEPRSAPESESKSTDDKSDAPEKAPEEAPEAAPEADDAPPQ